MVRNAINRLHDRHRTRVPTAHDRAIGNDNLLLDVVESLRQEDHLAGILCDIIGKLATDIGVRHLKEVRRQRIRTIADSEEQILRLVALEVDITRPLEERITVRRHDRESRLLAGLDPHRLRLRRAVARTRHGDRILDLPLPLEFVPESVRVPVRVTAAEAVIDQGPHASRGIDRIELPSGHDRALLFGDVHVVGRSRAVG